MRVVVALFYVLAALGALAGALELLIAMNPLQPKLDQAARAALACAFAVVPLALARAIEGIVKPWALSADELETRARLKAAEATAPGNQPRDPEPSNPVAAGAASTGFSRRHS